MKNLSNNTTQNTLNKSDNSVATEKIEDSVIYKVKDLDIKDISILISKKMGEDDNLEIEFNVDTKGVEDFKRIFMGLIREANVIRTTGQFSKVILKAKSNTILMDEKRKYRSFQDSKLIYEDIINEEEYG